MEVDLHLVPKFGMTAMLEFFLRDETPGEVHTMIGNFSRMLCSNATIATLVSTTKSTLNSSISEQGCWRSSCVHAKVNPNLSLHVSYQ